MSWCCCRKVSLVKVAIRNWMFPTWNANESRWPQQSRSHSAIIEKSPLYIFQTNHESWTSWNKLWLVHSFEKDWINLFSAGWNEVNRQKLWFRPSIQIVLDMPDGDKCRQWTHSERGRKFDIIGTRPNRIFAAFKSSKFCFQTIKLHDEQQNKLNSKHKLRYCIWAIHAFPHFTDRLRLIYHLYNARHAFLLPYIVLHTKALTCKDREAQPAAIAVISNRYVLEVNGSATENSCVSQWVLKYTSSWLSTSIHAPMHRTSKVWIWSKI